MFEKHCLICGIEVDKKMLPKRFGKYFCSEDRAQKHVVKREEQERQMEEKRRRNPQRGGFC
jgi:hypothetical protein